VDQLFFDKIAAMCSQFLFSKQNLRDKTLAGKKALFEVTVLDASHRSLPELTDEFANMVRPGLNVENLLSELKKAVDSEDLKEYVGARNSALSAGLAKVMDVEVPDTLVTKQAQEKFALMMTEMRDNGLPDEEIKKQISPENFAKYKKIVKGDIVQDFKVSMAADEIARMEGIEVPDYAIEEQLENIRKDAQGQEFDENMVRQKVEVTLLRGMVFDFLAEHANLEVKYATETFDEELMEKLAADSLAREQAAAAAETEGKVTTVIRKEAEVLGIEMSDTVTVENSESTTEVAEVIEDIAQTNNEEVTVVEDIALTPEEEEAAREAKDIELSAKYAAIEDVGDKCYEILLDLGMLDDREEDLNLRDDDDDDVEDMILD
jgi:Bacterial trigger factor protein (TF) C-terminus